MLETVRSEEKDLIKFTVLTETSAIKIRKTGGKG
jgi:hypothetical protein